MLAAIARDQMQVEMHHRLTCYRAIIDPNVKSFRFEFRHQNRADLDQQLAQFDPFHYV